MGNYYCKRKILYHSCLRININYILILIVLISLNSCSIINSIFCEQEVIHKAQGVLVYESIEFGNLLFFELKDLTISKSNKNIDLLTDSNIVSVMCLTEKLRGVPIEAMQIYYDSLNNEEYIYMKTKIEFKDGYLLNMYNYSFYQCSEGYLCYKLKYIDDGILKEKEIRIVKMRNVKVVNREYIK